MTRGKAVFIDPAYGWRCTKRGSYTVYFAGREQTVTGISGLLPEGNSIDLRFLGAQLARQKGHFGIIAESPDWIVAIGDKVRGYPLFYSDLGRSVYFSNAARLLRDRLHLTEIDDASRIELHMAGYVSGRYTVFKNLFQVRAGEILLWEKEKKKLHGKQYYVFHSQNVRVEKEDDLVQELDEITNVIFRRITEDSAGRPILVPLSGGLDSRLVVCKLRELKYDNLKSFSYGVPGNSEAKIAKIVCEKIGVPWTFVPSTREETRAFFRSPERPMYWAYADGLNVVPNLHTICALKSLRRLGLIDETSIVINGQSGDFIAGNHIPLIDDRDANIDCLRQKIIEKHYSLRRSWLRDASKREFAAKRIDAVLDGGAGVSTKQDFAKAYELWEWQERQAKRVVNGQRNYDYLGFGWELPLWEIEYLRFWAEVPLRFKLNRWLFCRYLEAKDFFQLFRKFKPTTSRWPGGWIAVPFIGAALRRVFGGRLSRWYYDCLEYFSTYSYCYSHLDYPQFLPLCHDYRTPLAYFVDVWERETIGPNGGTG